MSRRAEKSFSFLRKNRRPLVMGHRGVMGIRPENTIASFRKAIELGVDIIELDLHLSRDGKLVVIHDELLDRTTNGSGYVKDQSSARLAKLDAGSWFDKRYRGERVPFLEDVIALIGPSRTALNIEIKNGPVFYRGIAKKTLKAVVSAGILGRTVFSSFDHEVLCEVKRLEPSATVAPLVVCQLARPARYLELIGADGIHPRWNFVTKDFVQEVRAAGFFVNSWIHQDQATIDRFRRWGVDGIAVNDPTPFRF